MFGCEREPEVPTASPPATATAVSPAARASMNSQALEQAVAVLEGDLEDESQVMNALLVLQSHETPVRTRERSDVAGLGGTPMPVEREVYSEAGLEVTYVGGRVQRVESLRRKNAGGDPFSPFGLE